MRGTYISIEKSTYGSKGSHLARLSYMGDLQERRGFAGGTNISSSVVSDYSE